MTLEKRFEEIDDGWTPQLSPSQKGKKMTPTTTSLTTRAEMIATIKLSDPTFDSTRYSDAYLAGRSGSKMPTPGVAKSIGTSDAPVAKLDETDLSPVTKAMIACEDERDRARVAISSVPTKAKRLDANDAGLSPVTLAQIAAHNRDEARRRGGGYDGGSGSAA